MRLTALWLNETAFPEVTVFTDFSVEDADSKSPEHLLKLRAAGDLTLNTLWTEFRRREILGPEFDEEAELEALLKEVPGDDEIGDVELDDDGNEIDPDGSQT